MFVVAKLTGDHVLTSDSTVHHSMISGLHQVQRGQEVLKPMILTHLSAMTAVKTAITTVITSSPISCCRTGLGRPKADLLRPASLPEGPHV